MFKTLRSRLFLSYLAVITLVLLVIAVVLFLISAQPAVRYFPVLLQLNTISQSQRRLMQEWGESEGNRDRLEEAVKRLAEDSGYRILIANPNSQRVIFDSENYWVGAIIPDIEPVSQRLLPNADQNALFGRFQAQDRTYWLVYSPSASSIAENRLQIYFAQPEPTAVSFFRQTFFRPLVGAGVLALLLAILFAVVISASVARPLQQMAVAAEAVADGEYNQQLSLRGPEEVGRLAASFNLMATQVEMSKRAQQDFVANVSHDLKTPITSVRGWSQSLLDGTAETAEQQRQAAEIIHKEAGRMSRMVGQLLDLARIEFGQLELNLIPVDLNQVMADVQDNLGVRAEENGIHLTLEEITVPQVFGDYDRLVQVFTNLVDNALTHTASGGRVHLLVRPHGEKAVEGVVQDTGQGIPPDELSRIFERFYQVDKSRARPKRGPGSGLGLAIVKELVEAHNGRIQARSQVGEGSIFIVRLPMTDDLEPSTFMRRNP